MTRTLEIITSLSLLFDHLVKEAVNEWKSKMIRWPWGQRRRVQSPTWPRLTLLDLVPDLEAGFPLSKDDERRVCFDFFF